METDDGDFIDLDLVNNGANKVAILCHGLEGSSGSKYIQGSSVILSQAGFDICAMNHRSCSGEMNRSAQMYHSGWTQDLDAVVRLMAARYEQIFLVGFSLGGNLVLKYSGEMKMALEPKIKAICAISVPLNLHSASLKMEKLENRLYTWRFLKTLNEKIRQKHLDFPDQYNPIHLSKVKTVKDFDDFYTGPNNGFVDAKDYYDQCSADQFLKDIRVPSLILNAKDDPFLSKDCFPSETEIKNKLVKTSYPKYGGHVGFYLTGTFTWCEIQIRDFLVPYQ